MLRTVHLHGRLGQRFGKTYRLDVQSPAEAVRALMVQLPDFEGYIRNRSYCVTAGRSPERQECQPLTEQQLQLRLGKSRDIHIVPAPLMAGVETIIIVGLVLVSVVLAAAMIFMMKAPKPQDREEQSKRSSWAFDGPENSIEQGHCVPLIYGEVRAGSVVVSAGITTADIGADPANLPGGKSGFADGSGTDADGSGGSGYVGATEGVDHTVISDPADELQYGDIALEGGGGGKAGGGGGDGMQEAPNSLQSNATARILEAVSEGEIVGLVDGLKSVYLDGTPLQNADDSFNFQGATVQQRVGLPDQDYIPGFAQAENSIEVDSEVTVLLGPITRTINNQDVSIARVTIRIPSLYKQETDDGDINPTKVELKISVQVDGGGFTDVYQMKIDGKTNSGYDRSVDIHLPAGVVRDIRVTRLTADSDVASLNNKTFWAFLSEIIEAKLSYPDTALIGMTVDARQFGTNIPARAYQIKGLIIEVPSNYDPVARTYTGVWDGTWVRRWTDNPAFCLRDLIVARRYGLGARVPVEALDKWVLYSIAQYCDELVPDMFGGTEPRYTLNTQIKNKMGAYELIASMASNFRGWVYWGSGSIVPAMDRPEDPSVLVTRSNTVDGLISYGRITAHEKRRSIAVVYYNDPQDRYRLAPEIVEDPDLIRRFGRRSGDEVTAFGVTRKGHAHRLARFILEDESPASNVSADYQVGDDHSFVAPARIAMVADPMFTAARRGGRVRAATANNLTIDQPYVFVAGQVYSVRVMLPDGSVSVRAITNAPGAATLVTLGGAAWGTPPNPGAVWTIETDLVANRQFRVRSIETDRPPYRVKAVAHDPTKYERVEQDRDLETPNFLEGPVGPLGEPSALGVFEYLVGEGTASVPAALFGWTPPPDPRVLFFQAQAKGPVGDWFPLGDSLEPTRVVRPTTPGAWQFRVRAVDGLGRRTRWHVGDALLDGQTDSIPEVVAPGITVDSDLLSATLIWDAPDDTRPLRYEIMYSAGGAYGTAVSLGVTDQLTWPITMQGNYWVRPTFLGFISPAPTLVNASALIFSAGIVPHLTNETVALPADASGVVASYAAATGEFKIYSGSTDISSAFALSTPAGGDPQALTEAYVGRLYSVTAGFDAGEDTATLRIRATGSGDWAGVVLDKDFTLTKAKQGVTGKYRDIKFKRAVAPPAAPVVAAPADWADGVPAGVEALWMTVADKNADGSLIGAWSTPQQLTTQNRGDYSATATYYVGDIVSFGSPVGSYVAVQNNFINHPPSGTGQPNSYWDVLAAPGGTGDPATPPSAFSATIDLPTGGGVNLRTLADAAGYTGLSNATVTFEVENAVTVRGLSGGKAVDTGIWPTADYTITLDIRVKNGGKVEGGMGIGGASGDGLPGSAGGAGGDAIYCRLPIAIVVDVGGAIKSGGGGGGGGGGWARLQGPPGEEELVTGIGGIGGNGADGSGNSTAADNSGKSLNAGDGGAGGAQGAAGTAGSVATAGGGATNYGGGGGGAAGYAIRKNGHVCPVTNNGTITGAQG